MTRRRIHIIRCFLEVFIQVSLFFSIAALAFFGPLELPVTTMYGPAYVALVTVVTYLIRKVTKGMGIFFLSHGVLIALGIMLGATVNESFFIGLMSVLVCFFSFMQKRKLLEDKPEQIHIAFAGAFLVEFFCGYNMDSRVVMECSIWMAVIFVLAQVFYINFGRLDNLYSTNRDTYNFPGRRVVSTNLLFLCTTAFMMLFGMLVFYSGPLGNIFVMLKNLFLKFLGWFLSLFLKADRIDEIQQMMSSSTMPSESESETESGYREEPVSDFKDVINTILILVAIIAIIACIVGIYRAIKKIFEASSKIKGANNDVIESLDEIDEFKEDKKDKEPEITDKDLNMRARKIYKRHVRSVSKTKGSPSDSAMPIDITKMIASEENVQSVNDIYEKARYSNEAVTKEEIDIIKKL